MSNEDVSATIDGDYLVVRIRMQTPERSSTGKTMVVASTHGQVKTDAEVDGQPLSIGLNAYYKPKK
jgi:hypothetical protein